VTTKDKRLFIIGWLKAFEFNLSSNLLHDKEPMKEERSYAAVAYEHTQDKIFVMGGSFKDTCEYYDVNQDEWTEFAKLSEKKWFMSASTLINRYIYLFGGIDNDYQELDTIEQYDFLDRHTWVVINVKLLKSQRLLTSVSISISEILLFGG